MYLYFYVGQFTQTATEQTAGLNAELFNGKVDLNLNNIDNANNAAATNLNTKGIRTVIETYSNGTDWYRVWSDGWCEQGGQFSGTSQGQQIIVDLLVEYVDTNYSIVSQQQRASVSSGCYPMVVSKAVDSITFRVDSSTVNYWEAKGYIA